MYKYAKDVLEFKLQNKNVSGNMIKMLIMAPISKRCCKDSARKCTLPDTQENNRRNLHYGMKLRVWSVSVMCAPEFLWGPVNFRQYRDPIFSLIRKRWWICNDAICYNNLLFYFLEHFRMSFSEYLFFLNRHNVPLSLWVPTVIHTSILPMMETKT